MVGGSADLEKGCHQTKVGSSRSSSISENPERSTHFSDPEETTTTLRTQATEAEEDVVNLPYRTLSEGADMTQYTREVALGHIVSRIPTQSGEKIEAKLVTFTIDDPQNPKNWSKARKWWCTVIVAFTCFVVAFNSAVITSDIEGVVRTFNVSEEVALLSITLFVVGFGVGPMMFAPLSESIGRKPIYTFTLLVAVVFIVPCAVAKNIETLLVCRFIDGIAFSAPMVLVGGTLADLWHNNERGVPMAFFSAAPFSGPAIGPLVGGYLSDAMGWRWLYWIQLILSGAVYLLITLTVPETYAPKILAQKAARLRKQENDNTYTTEMEIGKRPLSERMLIFLVRPFKLLFRELIVFLLSLYMSVLYGLLYMFFVAYPIIYQRGKGYTAGKTGLMFIPVAVGVMCSACCAPLVNKDYLKRAAQQGGKAVPETRLIPMMFSCWAIPIGLFIFAWSSQPETSWAGPAMGGFCVGFGFIFLYNSANNYLVDSYQHLAASALAAKTFIRSFWGAAVVLFTTQMYDRLGYEWASTLLAFIALACCAIPFLFYRYGARIRQRSHYAYSSESESN
ncbi:MFS general substrate transporter [Myriangium duriaei CBS 260.36]|uniref:Cercosporin MFS transporter CTB4 n=1 Tax=Myriangium duriaei CBS 260.36 TaxID=1168546 RepID=A0A9P4JAZ3_9PEZI|nr:MFS general substrate transporter [Myriangium duriaei CBS 260.36]